MTLFLSDPDVTLYHGDVCETLRTLETSSVDCVVTSPPYWGLRDYGTGSWEGGNPDCDHRGDPTGNDRRTRDLAAYVRPESGKPTGGGGKHSKDEDTAPYRDVCGKCGARRVDNQLGLEPTPELYVENMVDVFREVWRVLADHGTCWVNMGDSYNSRLDGSHGGWNGSSPEPQRTKNDGAKVQISAPGLKPKDLVGVPWKLAFALQADGWYLRSDIVWSKPNPMPESVTDRPTKAHEYVFLLSKRPRYFFDQEAVREPQTTPAVGMAGRTPPPNKGHVGEFTGERAAALTAGGWIPNGYNNPAGRNIRSVWEIATQPYPEAHFATFPEELARRCILAGCPEWVCGVCGKPRERQVDVEYEEAGRNNNSLKTKGGGDAEAAMAARPYETRKLRHASTSGWSDCGHGNYRPGRVLDPFVGSGTVPHVARKHGRHAIGIDLNGDYLKLAAKRLQQLRLEFA